MLKTVLHKALKDLISVLSADSGKLYTTILFFLQSLSAISSITSKALLQRPRELITANLSPYEMQTLLFLMFQSERTAVMIVAW